MLHFCDIWTMLVLESCYDRFGNLRKWVKISAKVDTRPQNFNIIHLIQSLFIVVSFSRQWICCRDCLIANATFLWYLNNIDVRILLRSFWKPMQLSKDLCQRVYYTVKKFNELKMWLSISIYCYLIFIKIILLSSLVNCQFNILFTAELKPQF